MRAKTKITGVLYSILMLAVLYVLITNYQLCRDSVGEALLICRNLIIPSLFPYMIFSRYLMASPLSSVFHLMFGKLSRKLLNLPGECISVFLLGSICGFPITAKCASQMYRDGVCSKNQAERLLCLANNAGCAFTVSIAGGLVLGSMRSGVALYVIQLVSAIIAHQIILFLHKDGFVHESVTVKAKIEVRTPELPVIISESVVNVFSVCGTIVFFTITMNFVREYLGEHELLCLITNGVLELSTAVGMLADLLPSGGFAMASAFICWAGLSVHTQTAVILKDSGISLKLYLFSKATQSGIGALMAWIYTRLFASSITCISFVSPSEIVMQSKLRPYFYIYIISFIFIIAIVFMANFIYNIVDSKIRKFI